ncbi:MAG: hypothetical protein M9952_06140 [Microthrixaceae bacterium]|nr:hypothetical protein [Microthrixaceae bacterium]
MSGGGTLGYRRASGVGAGAFTTLSVRPVGAPVPVLSTGPGPAELGRVALEAVRFGSVDAAGLERRAEELGGRVVTGSSLAAGLDLTIRCMDLVGPENLESASSVAALASRAGEPDRSDPACPAIAAVRVDPRFVAAVTDALAGSPVRVVSGTARIAIGEHRPSQRLVEIGETVTAGAHEVDIVFEGGQRYSDGIDRWYEAIVAATRACAPAKLNVGLELGGLDGYQEVRRASMVAMAAGADMIRIATGTRTPRASQAAVLCVSEAISDFAVQSGRRVGLKVDGNALGVEQALRYLVIVNETLGIAWLRPDWFRLASTGLLDEVVEQRRTGRS